MTSANEKSGALERREHATNSRQLFIATASAVSVAIVLLVTVILPAEYGVDPIGTGRLLGLNALRPDNTSSVEMPAPMVTNAEIAPVVAEVAEVAAATVANINTATAEPTLRNDRTELVLQPNEGVEVKATMQVGEEMQFSWKTDGAPLYFDFHGEKFNAAQDEFTSYVENTDTHQEGTFKADFAGIHGWYWKNRSAAPVRVILDTSGNYAQIKRVH